jgi:UDP-glucose 4-epimerase
LIYSTRVTPIVYDNLSNDDAAFVQWDPLEVGDIRDRQRLDQVLEKCKPQAIIHFAAAIEVAESIRNPSGYYDNNVAGTIMLLRAAQTAGINQIVFFSTCATYGIPTSIPMSEAHAQSSINLCGRSKLIVEHILKDLRHSNLISRRILATGGWMPRRSARRPFGIRILSSCILG